MYWDQNLLYTYLDNDSNRILTVDMTKETFWQKGNFPPSANNPWQYSPNKNAPFDQEFFLIINMAVGGTSNYFPDGLGGKPWNNNDPHSVNAFYNARG